MFCMPNTLNVGFRLALMYNVFHLPLFSGFHALPLKTITVITLNFDRYALNSDNFAVC